MITAEMAMESKKGLPVNAVRSLLLIVAVATALVNPLDQRSLEPTDC